MEKDPRLTGLTDGNYRIWHDGEHILIPVGESISNPRVKEMVQCNTQAYGTIVKGFFNRLKVHFTNAKTVVKEFDYYYLRGWRDGEDLPLDDETIDLNKDLGLEDLFVTAELALKITTDDGVVFTSGYNGRINFYLDSEGVWRSNDITFSKPDVNGQTIICSGYFYSGEQDGILSFINSLELGNGDGKTFNFNFNYITLKTPTSTLDVMTGMNSGIMVELTGFESKSVVLNGGF